MKKEIPPDLLPQLEITENNGDIIKIYLTPDKFPYAYKAKHTELIQRSGMTEDEATAYLITKPTSLELFYSPDQGLFGVESEALDRTPIFNPYSGEEIPTSDF